jgi:natural product precursor
MKQKRPGKKLNLNKKTIAALDSHQLNAAYGGIDTTFSGESDCVCRQCNTEDPISCPPPRTQDPTATIMRPACPCCY